MLDRGTDKLEALRAVASAVRCPRCDDPMIAPVAAEFVAGGEIRHHWECDACGADSPHAGLHRLVRLRRDAAGARQFVRPS